jgi:hypothetical protein
MSRKPEQQMWAALRPYMTGLDPVRIESPMRSGIPDVNYSHGWIELKQLAGWPRLTGTPVAISHFTVEQRAFLTKRVLAGGRAYLMLRVGLDDWLLFNGARAAELIGGPAKLGLPRGVPAEELKRQALRHWQGVPRRDDLQRVLCQ